VSTFTVEEDPQPVGNITGKINHVNLTSLPGATVSLYQDGAPYDMTASAANGTFQFNNIAVGSYYVNVTKAGGLHRPAFRTEYQPAVPGLQCERRWCG